jgi:hypothetical protein
MAYVLSNKPKKVLVGGRRSGKTTVVSGEIAEKEVTSILTGTPLEQLIVAPAMDQAILLFQRVAGYFEKRHDGTERPLGKFLVSKRMSPFPELRFLNGGVIRVRSTSEGGKHLRAHAAGRIIVEEAAYVPDDIVNLVLAPMLADTGGQMVLLCTPGAKGALFHKLFVAGQNPNHPTTESFHLSSEDNVHLDLGYVREQKEVLTELEYEIEWKGNFADEVDSVFKWDHIRKCAVGEEAPVHPAHRYSIGWDPALKRDRSVVWITDCSQLPWRAVQIVDLKGMGYEDQAEAVATYYRAFNGAKVTIDQTGIGDALAQMLRTRGVWVEGFTFNRTKKADLITALCLMIEKQKLIIPASRKDVIDEFRFYRMTMSASGATYGPAIEDKKGTKKDHINDDCVTAAALSVKGAGPLPMLHPETVSLAQYLTAKEARIHDPEPMRGTIVSPEGALPDEWVQARTEDERPPLGTHDEYLWELRRRERDAPLEPETPIDDYERRIEREGYGRTPPPPSAEEE